jgi:acyl-coenzyme A synthetase/AMP-(fatty) acid ligase/alkanesulfonate monooxygenase SsuD/methylene tetrahydromethanopterin reductase-like flavin-dependent oxidoreductase (luciferase family)
VAALTSRAGLGISVLSASYRHPALAAKMATVLDVISGGRLVVGLGTGSDRDEHGAYGIPFGSPGERTAGLRRALDVMRAMTRSPTGATLGDQLRDAPNMPAPAQAHLPIWLAAHGPRLLRLAGEQADGVISAFCSPQEIASRRASAEAARAGANRPALAYALYTYVLPLSSEGEALDWLRPEASALGTTPQSLLRWVRSTGIVGGPGEVREALAAYAEAGVTDAILVLPNRVPADAIDALADAVLPAAPGTSRGGGSTAARHNLVHLLVEGHREAGRGDAVAVVDEGGSWTYDELGDASARAAGALAQRGVRKGDRVGVALRDGRHWCAAFLGAARLGAVPVPLDPTAAAERLADVVDDCEPALVVCEEGATVLGTRTAYSDDLAGGAPHGVVAVHPADLAYLIYSSGSTGRPKAVMHGHGDMAVSVNGYSRAVLGLAPGQRSHSVARLFTSLGFGNGFFRPLGTGAACVFTRAQPTVRSAAATVRDHGITVLTGVPTFWLQLATFLERHPDEWSAPALRLAVSSGDSLPAAMGTRVRDALGVDLIEGFGCSECSNVIISTLPGRPMPGALGHTTPGVEVRLADDEGRAVEPGTPGRLWVRSESNTSGYWRRTEETRDLVYGPWLRMGDVLRQDGDVYRHMGRADDLFKVDARWVSPTEVESALLEHPAVSEVAVVGLPDANGLLRPAAFVVPAEGARTDLADDLRRHVARLLEPYKAPATVTVLDALPRLASGKLNRRALREAPDK